MSVSSPNGVFHTSGRFDTPVREAKGPLAKKVTSPANNQDVPQKPGSENEATPAK